MIFRDKNVNDIECDESIVVFNITEEVDSINFKNAIMNPFELPEFEKDIEEMIIEYEFGNDYFGNLIIQNYPNLQSIIVKKNSLQNVGFLKISNCEQLKTIEIKDGEEFELNGDMYSIGAFKNVKTMIIESITIIK